MLPCVAMQCGILALPFHSARTDWEQLPVAVASLIHTEGQTIRQPLHKAEQHVVDDFEFVSQQCRSYRYAAEVLQEDSILMHIYWGMGLHGQRPSVHGKVDIISRGHQNQLDGCLQMMGWELKS